MTRLLRWMAWLAALVLGGYLLIYTIYPYEPLWYRLSFEVETPEGFKRADGVRLVYDWHQWNYLTPSSGGRTGAGEAIPIDLGPRGVLFALMTPRNEDGTPSNTSPVSVPFDAIYKRVKGDWPRVMSRLRTLETPLALQPGEIPFLVRFRDLKDPKTVEAVDPQTLAASFGDGVRLKSVTLEFVSSGIWPLYLFGIPGARLTTGIETWLPWLNQLGGRYLHGGSTSRNSPLGLHTGHFRVGR